MALVNTHSLDLERSSSQYAYIEDGDQTGLDLAGNFTIEAWIKRESTGVAMTIAGKYDSTNNLRQYTFQIRSDNALQLGVSDDGTNSAGHLRTFVSTSTITTTANWVHVAVTFDIASETCYFYINGTEESPGSSSGTGIGASLYNGTVQFRIGSEVTSGGQYFDGLIDEVRVWSVVRTQSEIANNRNKELLGTESNLVGYWKLNNSYVDETANGNDLTASGAPSFSTTIPTPFTQVTSFDESIALVDTIARQGGKTLNETATITDTIARALDKSMSETITLVDTISSSFLFTKELDEILTLADVDAENKITGKTLSEALSLIDETYKSAGKVIGEALTLEDTINRGMTASLVESVTLADTLSRQINKNLNEIIALVDDATSAAQYSRSLDDTIVLAETISKTVDKVLTDSAVLVDTLTRAGTFARSMNETATLQERFQGLINGQDISWIRKYANQVGTYIQKYLDIP